MPFQIIKSDLVSVTADAIVYAETPQPFSLFQFNPLTIHKTGKEILNTREALKPIMIGDAKIAPASLLDCKYIIHTSAPAWHGGGYHELGQLRNCYKKVFDLALEQECKSIATPIIASDKLGYPKSVSQKTAFECVKNFLVSHGDLTITFVLAGKTGIMLPGNQFTNVNMHLNKNYVKPDEQDAAASNQNKNLSLEEMNAFAEKLSAYMVSAGISKEEFCLKANITPDVLDRIFSNKEEILPKTTVTGLAMALELPLDEFKEFLAMAGYTITKTSKFDLIIEYCITSKIYDVFDVNQILFRFEQDLVG